MDKHTDHTKFIIQRYDNYIAAANVKGNFLLAFNTFLTGGIITNYSKLKDLIQIPCGLLVLDFSLILLSITSILATIYVIKAVYPYLSSGTTTDNNYISHIFFGSVAKFKDGETYFESFKNLTEVDFDKDLSFQAYQLSKGLKLKYYRLKWAMRFVYFELFCILFIISTITIF